MAWLAIAAIVLLMVLGFFLHELSWETLDRGWHDIGDRTRRPMSLRFILQPTMAAIAAFRDGLQDARARRSPYLWTILTDASQRRKRLSEGLMSSARLLLIGLAMDLIYQFIVLKALYPVEAVIIALMLAFLPYLLLRGVVTRGARIWLARKSGKLPAPGQ
jgi:hypothetical protein